MNISPFVTLIVIASFVTCRSDGNRSSEQILEMNDTAARETINTINDNILMQRYKPEAQLYSRNTYREVFRTDNYIFLVGQFSGGWGDRQTGGKFTGNMANLLKRDINGRLLMYRQLANNDH